MFFCLGKSAADSHHGFRGKRKTSCAGSVNLHANVVAVVTADRESTVTGSKIHHARKLWTMLPDDLPIELDNVRRRCNLGRTQFVICFWRPHFFPFTDASE